MKTPWALAAATALLLSHAAIAAAPPNPAKSPDATARLARSSNAFGFDLYQRLRRTPGNLVFSPASLTGALTLTWAGARGETAAQMKKALHLQGTPNEVLAASGRLSASLQASSRPVVLRIANQIFAEKTYKLLPAFVEKARAPVELLDFKTAPEPSRVHINQWIESRTERRIRDLVPPGQITPLTRLVLANAIYFLGSWEDPFDPQETRSAPFYLAPSRKKMVPTMSRDGMLRAGRKDGVTVVELPYKGGGLSMLLLVPDKVDGLAAVEEALGTKQLDALRATMREGFISLSMPKFELSPGASLALREDLEALGVRSAFDLKKADLTGIASPARRTDRLVLENVFHKGFVRVDERGTEAAAASAFGEVMGSDLGPPPRQIQADRPFLFLIRDNASGMILFLGRVSDPGRR